MTASTNVLRGPSKGGVMFNRLTIITAIGLSFAVVSDAANLRFTNEEGQPVVGATVRLGPVHAPIHEAKTNLNGDVDIPSEWSSSLTIAVDAKGYVSTVFQDRDPVTQNLILNFNDSRTPH